MNEMDIQKWAYRPVCNTSEIDRIFNVSNANDYLLKLRADTIVDHMRLFRVYRNKANSHGVGWSLEQSFDNSHYERFLEKLSPDHKQHCEKVTYGDIFSNDPNGMIFGTEYGVVTTVSESLKYFLKFCHLAILDFKSKVPMRVRLNSLRIALRTMLKTEAMDFLMDPRGIIPRKISDAINTPIQYQMQFIAGHEFSHFLLGHLDKNDLVEQPIFYAVGNDDADYRPEKIFNSSQKNEFEADLHSFTLPMYSDAEKADLLSGALLWFGCLELYQAASDVMFPRSPWAFKSHPSARERYESLLTRLPTPKSFELAGFASFHELIDELIKFIQDDISLNIEGYENYGSAYLDLPNTKWRGRALIDRVDYY